MAETTMTKITKKLFCLFLTIVCVLSTFAGCGESQEVPVPVIVPEVQIFEDSYERNEDITNMLGYTIDYITTPGPRGDKMEIVNLFDHMKVQVDNWDSLTIGMSTMGEIASNIDRVNENYVTERTNALIAERQKIIDEEYEAAVKKAEEKGKTYDKPKKEVRTDDIHFDAPYTYYTTFSDVRDRDAEEFADDYKPTLLVDPSRYGLLYLTVEKYGIPYVELMFQSTDLYNYNITQESDWVINGIYAADVSDHVNETTGEWLEYVDDDGLNRAAKENIIMSGNIAFGDNGFTWESLMMFCNALGLQYSGHQNNGAYFEQSSDADFTYYTITLTTNPFENDNMVDEYGVYAPITTLIATFDPLTQVCLNFEVDTFSDYKAYPAHASHDLSEPILVNVHEYQVDTNDYEGMRTTIKNWIKDNSVQTTTKYCVVNPNTGNIEGTIETGTTNLFIEPIIDGVAYNCLDHFEENGNLFATYIKTEDLAASEELGNQQEADKYIAERQKTWKIVCGVFDEDEMIGEFVKDSRVLKNCAQEYQVAYFEETDHGYQNVRVLAQDKIQQLLMVYVKTYRLNQEQNVEMQDVYNNQGAVAVANYINNLFAEAEKQQAENKTIKQETED